MQSYSLNFFQNIIKKFLITFSLIYRLHSIKFIIGDMSGNIFAIIAKTIIIIVNMNMQR